MPYDVVVTEQPIYAILNLRGDAEVRAVFSEALEINLPTEVSVVASKGDVHVLTIGPDEWLVSALGAEEEKIEKKLKTAVKGMFAGVTVVSDMHKVYRISGPEARDVLAQGTSLDLHSRAFIPGQCARTAFAKTTGAVIHQIDEVPTYDVYIESSFVGYMQLWFDTASGKVNGG